MLKFTRLTLVLTTACAFFPIKSTFAQFVTYPVTSNSRISNLYCYMETQAGTTLDLSSLCATNKTTSSNNIAASASAGSATRINPIGGSSAGSSGISGGGRAASERAGGRTGNGSSSDVNPNNAVERAAQDGKNAVDRVAQQAQEEVRRILEGGGGSSSGGGNCNNPNDLAADGSRCGGRAASERAGGRTGN